MVNYKDYITIEPGKRSGKPCIRGLRISVCDVLNMLADGISFEEIIDDFPKLTKEDILACLAYAAVNPQDEYHDWSDYEFSSYDDCSGEACSDGWDYRILLATQ